MSSIVFLYHQKKLIKLFSHLKKIFLEEKFLFVEKCLSFMKNLLEWILTNLELFNKELKGELTIVISEKGEMIKKIYTN